MTVSILGSEAHYVLCLKMVSTNNAETGQSLRLKESPIEGWHNSLARLNVFCLHIGTFTSRRGE